MTLLFGIGKISLPSEGLMMKNGQAVTVETYDHKLIQCRLIEVRGRTAVVCSEREWAQAKREQREPNCIGWPLANVQEARSK